MVDHRTIDRNEAIIIINEQIAAHEGGILTALAPFEAASAIETWHGTIRDIEEFINVLMFGIDDERWGQRIEAVVPTRIRVTTFDDPGAGRGRDEQGAVKHEPRSPQAVS